MQKAAKVLGAQLGEAYASRQQLESQLSNESQITALEQQVSELETGKEGQSPAKKGAMTRNQKALRARIEELRAVKIENPEAQARLYGVNANISRLEQHVTYVQDPNNPARGNYKAVGGRLTNEQLSDAAVQRTGSIRNAYSTIRSSALAGEQAAFDAAVENLNSLLFSEKIPTFPGGTGTRSAKAKESLDALVQKHRDVLQSEIDYAGSPVRGPIDRRLKAGSEYTDAAVAGALAEAKTHADGAAAGALNNAKTYADGSVAAAMKEANNNLNNFAGRTRRWFAYTAAAIVIATGVAIGGYFYGKGGELAITDADKQDIASLVTPVPGPQGAKGDTGAAGPAGRDGAPGAAGAAGEGGAHGAVGPQGTKGDTGAAGRDGVGVVDYSSPEFQNAVGAAVEKALAGMQTPTPDGLAGIRAASNYGFSYPLAEAMYRSNPSGFVAAFGIVPQAASQVPNWFDGNPANAEATTIDGKVMTVNGSGVHLNLLPNGKGAEFTADPAKAKTFVVDYLAANPGMVGDVVIGGN